MKTRYFFSIFMVLFLFFSCTEENEMINSDGTLVSSTLKFEEAKLAINAMGLDTTFISEWDNYYVVEGDILICKDSVDLSRPITRQYITNYSASDSEIIYIGVDNTIAQNTNWREAVQEVIRLYNENTGLQLRYRETSPTINITKGKISDVEACAAGTFPTYFGKPGNKVVINTNFIYNIDTYLSLSQKVFLLMHEMGHNLGLRHTNGSGEGDAGIGLNQIPGTPTSDPNSYMNSNTCGLYWNGFSQYDLIALRYYWPIQHTVTFQKCSISSIRVIDGGYLGRSYFPISTTETFSGWYEDAALTIPWNYYKTITKDITLYAKWRAGGAKPIQTSSDKTSPVINFTLNQTTGVTFAGTLGRGLNEWWELYQYKHETYVILGKTSSILKRFNMDEYIWNANPETYIEHSEKIVLDAGTYWMAAYITKALGPQYGASSKHGVMIATIKY